MWYDLCVLYYIAISNHIHSLVVDTGEETIPNPLSQNNAYFLLIH